MSKYPDDWDEVRAKILRRAGGNEDDPRVGAKCEECGVTNYDVGMRIDGEFIPIQPAHPEDDFIIDGRYMASYQDAKNLADAENEFVKPDDERFIVIVLTIAHVHDPDPMNVDEDNLRAWCQKCHNSYDAEMRQRNAAVTRYQKKVDAGQMELFPMGDQS